MAFSPITPAEIGVGRPITHGLWDKVRRNFDDHQARLAAVGMGMGQVPNGSFEIDANNDGIPDGWTRHLYPGGSGSLESLHHSAHGTRCFIFTHPGGVGNGGGELISDFIEADPFVRKILHFVLWSSVPGINNVVQIRFFDRARTHFATMNVYQSTSNPGVPTYFIRVFTPPVHTRFIRIVLIGGFPDVNVAGQTTFDAVSLGSFPHHWRVRRDFTIPELSTASTGWADIGSASFDLQFNSSNFPISFHFFADLRATATGTFVNQRFRIGSVFSNEVSVDSTVYTTHSFQFPLFICSDVTMSSSLTIFQQLRTGNSAIHAIGRKAANIPPNFTTYEYVAEIM
ncbi:MAG: hypothetical protein DDT19_02926 [Syntrophomonadaceae bacterium]|nr:hypothetical protein [Bacillota bacterium]